MRPISWRAATWSAGSGLGAGGAAAIDGPEAAAHVYCVGGPAGRLLDVEAKQLGSASAQAFEIEGLIGARRTRALYRSAPG